MIDVMNYPTPTKEKYQRSINFDDAYISRVVPPWSRPTQYSAALWRNVVLNQPIAVACRETLIAMLLDLDWKISARDSEMQDELRPTIKYYTKLLEKGTYDGNDWNSHVEWVMTDLLDLPFGSASEIGRKEDAPGGRVMWIKPLDGGTLYPTLNKDFPIMQYYTTFNPVYFPAHAIARTFMSPRPEILREGWGMAPPEKAYFVFELLYRGDKYYANLLLDVPLAGILDFGDMDPADAYTWAKAYKEMNLGQADSFKIPVLAGHTTPAKFIPMGKVPNDLMYDRITLKYAAILCACYGMSLSDIGVQVATSGGETLAGTIRSERQTGRTGKARAKKKMKGYVNSFLPEAIQFNWVDYDGELNVALGRARLANATAFGQLIANQVITPDEVRLQAIADGLITISIPEKMPESEKKKLTPPAQKPPERPNTLGETPVPVSSGGHGEKSLAKVQFSAPTHLESHIRRTVKEIADTIVPIVLSAARDFSEDEMFALRSSFDDAVFSDLDELGLEPVLASLAEKSCKWVKFEPVDGIEEELKEMAKSTALDTTQRIVAYKYEIGEADSPELSEKAKKKLLREIDKCDFAVLANNFIQELDVFTRKFIVKSAVLVIKENLLTNDDIDTIDDTVYHNIVESSQAKIVQHFDDIVHSALELSMPNLIRQIEMR